MGSVVMPKDVYENLISPHLACAGGEAPSRIEGLGSSEPAHACTSPGEAPWKTQRLEPSSLRIQSRGTDVPTGLCIRSASGSKCPGILPGGGGVQGSFPLIPPPSHCLQSMRVLPYCGHKLQARAGAACSPRGGEREHGKCDPLEEDGSHPTLVPSQALSMLWLVWALQTGVGPCLPSWDL